MLGFVFNALQSSAKTTEVDLQNSLTVFITFHIELFLKKELVVLYSKVKYNSNWRFLL